MTQKFENLTPAAARLQDHFLATFVPPTEETERVWRALNSPQHLIEAQRQPHITMHQEQMLATMQEWERTTDSGKRYRLATKLRKAGIEPTDWVVKEGKGA